MPQSAKKQQRTQIILAVVIGMTLPCYGLGYLFVALNQRGEQTLTSSPVEKGTATSQPVDTDTPTAVIPTRYPTFTPTLSPTPTQTPTETMTSSPTATDTPTPQPTDTSTPTNTFTPTTSSTPTLTATITPSPQLETATATLDGS